MSARMNISLSDELNQQLERIAAQQETTKTEVFRRALQLYFAAKEGTEKGLKLGLIDPEEEKIKTEIVGL